MKKRYFAILAFVLAAACAAATVLCGQTIEIAFGEHGGVKAEELAVTLEQDGVCVEEISRTVEGGELRLKYRSVSPGKAFVEARASDEAATGIELYVHPTGVITEETYFGRSTGDIAAPVALILFLAAAVWACIRRFRAGLRENPYSYRNGMVLGLTVFLCFLALNCVQLFFRRRGLIGVIDAMRNTAGTYAMFLLPVSFVLSVMMAANSVSLMRREGVSWRSMLGVFLGGALCFATLLPGAIGEILQRSTSAVFDVHNMNGPALYIEYFTENSIEACVAYLECVLLGTVVLSVRAARHIPAFDRDYMLILGCQLMPDGTLTPLLKSRADRALEFARMQKEKTGRELVFVPSGGQGADEVKPEAEAIGSYLAERGVPEERILAETASANTYENVKNSMELIRRHAGEGEEPKIAFSTTNYHVFRAGMIAAGQGVRAEGIGSPTKRYFWLNAFVREFIATLVSERRTHAQILLALIGAALCGAAVLYLSNTR